MRASFLGLLLVCASAVVTTRAQSPLPLTLIDSTNGPIYAVAVHDHEIYIGGHFTEVDGISANGIAVKHGSNWTAVGGGIAGTVFALAFDSSGNLYAGGKFDSAGDIAASNIARWDGKLWQRLRGGLNDTVFTILLDSDTAYCGGTFMIADGDTTGPLAVWKEDRWDSMRRDIKSGSIRNLARYAGSNVAIIGSFTVGSDSIAYSVALSGFPIRTVPRGVGSGALCGVSHRGGLLCAGSDFFAFLGNEYQHYTDYMSGLHKTGTIFSLTQYDQKRFIAGGDFHAVGGFVDTFASFYDGATWLRFAPAPSYPIFAANHAGRVLYLAGGDSVAGELYSAYYRDTILMSVDQPSVYYMNDYTLNLGLSNSSASNDTLAILHGYASPGTDFMPGGLILSDLAPGTNSTTLTHVILEDHLTQWGAYEVIYSNSTDSSDEENEITPVARQSVTGMKPDSPVIQFDVQNGGVNFQIFSRDREYTSLKIFDVGGREVEALEEGWSSPGLMYLHWAPSIRSPSIYFYSYQHGARLETGKFIVW